MNIIWITKLSDSTPFKSTQFGMTKALRKKGHQVQLYLVKPLSSNTQSTPIQIFLPIIDFPIISGLIIGLYLLTFFPIIVRKNHIDVVIIDGDQILSPFCLVLRLMRPLLIWDIRSLPIDRSSSFLHDLSFYLSSLFVDALTTITPELRTLLIKRYHLKDKPIGLWTSAVSPDLFKNPMNYSDQSTRKDSIAFTVMYHGTYSPTRGIEELITSISYVPSTIRTSIKLLIIGIQQDDRMHLQSLIDDLSLNEQVDIIPPVEQTKIPSYIKQADVGVIPLPPQNLWWRVSIPLKTLEYLMMETPVIVTDIPFHHNLFSHCKCGMNLLSADPKDIAQAICWMYDHRNKIPEMGTTGKHYIETHYSFDNVSTDLESFIKSMMEKKKHGIDN